MVAGDDGAAVTVAVQNSTSTAGGGSEKAERAPEAFARVQQGTAASLGMAGTGTKKLLEQGSGSEGHGLRPTQSMRVERTLHRDTEAGSHGSSGLIARKPSHRRAGGMRRVGASRRDLMVVRAPKAGVATGRQSSRSLLNGGGRAGSVPHGRPRGGSRDHSGTAGADRSKSVGSPARRPDGS